MEFASDRLAHYTEFVFEWSAVTLITRASGHNVVQMSVQAESHRARERALHCRQRIEHSECQPSRPTQQWRVASEYTEQAVRERNARRAVGTTSARISGEAIVCSDRVAWRS